jgi:SAM-dependent methyltransferase
MGATLYDESFFADVEITARASALRVVPVVVRGWRPRHVVDVGCGQGVWAAAFEAMGVPTLAIDGEHVRREQVLAPTFLAWDLARRLPVIGRFDLCVCLEVAEHLPATAAGTLVESLTEASDRILFSAAVPGQGGTGHVNEQPHEYWIEHFERLGFSADTGWRDRFGQDEDVAWWYRQNLIVLERREPRPDAPPGHLAAPAAGNGAPNGGAADAGSPIGARRVALRHHLDVARAVVTGRAQRSAGRLVDRLARPVLRRHAATERELIEAVEAIDACLADVATELGRLRAAVGDDDRPLRARLGALEYAVRRIHGPLLVDGHPDPDPATD